MSIVDYSAREWCQRRGICTATFYNRLKQGDMPSIIKIGRRTIITVEADQAWLRRMEALVSKKPTQTQSGGEP